MGSTGRTESAIEVGGPEGGGGGGGAGAPVEVVGSYFLGRPLDRCLRFMNSASSTIQKEPKSSS